MASMRAPWCAPSDCCAAQASASTVSASSAHVHTQMTPRIWIEASADSWLDVCSTDLWRRTRPPMPARPLMPPVW